MHHEGEPNDALRDGGSPSLPRPKTPRGVVPRRSLVRAAHALPFLPSPAPPVPRADYWSARPLLAEAGLPVRRRSGWQPPAETPDDDDLGLTYPLVVKALGWRPQVGCGRGDARHPRDRAAGGRVTDLRPPLARPPRDRGTAWLDDGVELIVGARQDPSFGPLLLVGLGAIYAETFRDTAIALAPVDEDGAVDLLRSLRGAPLLFGARGRPALAIDRVARVVSVLSGLAARHPEIAEMEINPVLVTRDDAVGVDARIAVAPPVY